MENKENMKKKVEEMLVEYSNLQAEEILKNYHRNG